MKHERKIREKKYRKEKKKKKIQRKTDDSNAKKRSHLCWISEVKIHSFEGSDRKWETCKEKNTKKE